MDDRKLVSHVLCRTSVFDRTIRNNRTQEQRPISPPQKIPATITPPEIGREFKSNFRIGPVRNQPYADCDDAMKRQMQVYI